MAAATSKRNDEYGFGVDAEALRVFFQEYESRVGIRSANMESIYAIAVHESVKPWACSACRKDWWGCRCKHRKKDRQPGDPEGAAVIGGYVSSSAPTNIGAHTSWDRYADIVPYLSESKWVYRKLKHLDDNGGSHHVMVLWRLYGPHNHRLDEPAFGEYGALAPFTDAVEEARADLACEVSEPKAERIGARVSRAHASRRKEIEAEFWWVAATIIKDDRRCAALAKHEAAIVRLAAIDTAGWDEKRLARHERAKGHHLKRSGEIRRKLEETARLVQAADDFQGQLIDAYSCDGAIRAVGGVITSTDRGTSPTDAIRWKLRPPAPTATTEERSAFTDERIRWVSRVKVQAHALQKAAHAAYRDARWSVG